MITLEEKIEIISIIYNLATSYPSINKIICNTNKLPSKINLILQETTYSGYTRLLTTKNDEIYAVGITEKGILFLIKNGINIRSIS